MPRPRVLPFIILGLLNKNGSMSGRDMIKEFKNEISEFWSVSHSQLYPELQRMLEEGDIDRHSPLLSEIFEKEFDLHNQKLKHLKERRQMLFQNQEQINNEYGHYLILTRAISA